MAWQVGQLKELGWVGADDVLRLAVHVRVRNGRQRCPDAASHGLALADPRRTYARYGGAWHCDVCGKSGEPGDRMFHCTAGCEYDLCAKCCSARERTGSLRKRTRRRPTSMPEANLAYWVNEHHVV